MTDTINDMPLDESSFSQDRDHRTSASSTEPAHAPLDCIIADVIDEALTRRPRYGAHVWHNVLLRELKDTPHKPPSASKFAKLLSAERRRRRSALEQAALEAGERVARVVGPVGLQVLPGTTPVMPADCVLVVQALVLWRSPRSGSAFGDYLLLAYRAGVSSMPLDVFSAFVLSPSMVGNVPHELMPEWWRRRLAREAKIAAAEERRSSVEGRRR